MPAFEIEGGWWLVLARAFSVTALLSTFGTLVFQNFVAARSFARVAAETSAPIEKRLSTIARYSAALCLAGTLAWLVAQSGDMANAASPVQAMRAVPAVLEGTSFGHLIGLQSAVLLVLIVGLATTMLRNRLRVMLAVATLAVALQAGHSHAASMVAGPSLLLGFDIVHLLGAGAWLGGLLPLLVVVRDAPPKLGATAARWFSPLGKLCIVALVASALFQSWVLIATVPGLVGTAYGWVALGKLALLGALLAFAAVNRYRLAPALLREDAHGATRVLVRSIVLQSGVGLGVLIAASTLSNLSPAMHTQPIWPFAKRFTLDTIGEDPSFRSEVIEAMLALCGAVLLAGAGSLIRHKGKWAAFAVAAMIAWFAVPHLDLLLVPAYPTSYFHSPTSFAANGIVQGASLFPGNCAACHGTEARGDGPAGKTLPVPPADLTAGHLWMHSDGELFWWLGHGIPAPDGQAAMPGFAGTLPEDDRWDLIDFIRAHNAGLAYRATGAWPQPLQAPGLQAECAGGKTMSLADLRGGFVRLVIGPADAIPDVTTIQITPDASAKPGPGLCVAHDVGLPKAYGIVSGIADADLAGTQFLIDKAGWLRAVQRKDTNPGWNDRQNLAAMLQQLEKAPIAMPMEMCHANMQM